MNTPNHFRMFNAFFWSAKCRMIQLTNHPESQNSSFPLYGPMPALSVIAFANPASTSP